MATLAELDLGLVLGFSVSPSLLVALVDVDRRLDRLERGPRRHGWVVGQGERSHAPGQPRPFLMGRTLSYPAASDDSYELNIDVWQRGDTTVQIEAGVEVYCFCPVNHNIERPAEQGWTAGSDIEVCDALATAVTALEGWVALGLDADQWRARAGLPARPGAP